MVSFKKGINNMNNGKLIFISIYAGVDVVLGINKSNATN